MNNRSSSYYVKLVVFCFFITSLPVILLGIFSYKHSSGVVQSNVHAQKILSLSQMQANVEQLLKTVDQSATHFLSSHLVQSALHEPLDPRQFTLFNQLKSELYYLQRLDTGINDITLLSRSGGWLINNSGSYRLADMPEQPEYMSLLDSPSPLAWMVRTPEGDQASTEGCSQEIRLIKKLPLTAYTPIGAAVVHIPACSLSDNISMDSDHESFLILGEDLNTVWMQGLRIGDTDGLRSSLARVSEPTGQLSLLLDEQTYTLTYRKSDYTGWTYVSAVPVEQLTKQSQGIGWYTLYICLALLLLFVFLSWLLSNRMYRPISSLYREVLADQQDGPVRGKRIDELKVIGERLRTLYRTQREMSDRMRGQVEQLKTFFMIKLALGGLKEEEITESLDQFGLHRSFRRLAVVSLQMELANTRFEPKDKELLMFAVNNMIAELVPESHRLPPILLGHSQVTVLTSDQDEDSPFRQELFILTEEIRDTVGAVLGLPVYIGISLSYEGLQDIPRAYEESVEALRSRARFGGQSIVDFTELGANHNMSYSYPTELQNELFEAVKLADREQSAQLLHRLMQEVCRSSLDPHDQQFHTIRLLMNVMSLAQSYDLQAEVMSNQQSLFDELFRLDIPKDGERWIQERLIGPILDRLEERTELRHLHLTRELTQIIHNEFETDLSIESCAERLHYNASYLSTIFRKSMKVPFSTYLAQYRHQMAKRWLIETDWSIKDIAERLRYNNSQNFIRSFRKQEDVPPGKYRELHSREGNAGAQQQAAGGGD